MQTIGLRSDHPPDRYLGDDRCWDLEDELAQRGGPAGQGGNAEIPDELAEVAGVQRLAGSASASMAR